VLAVEVVVAVEVASSLGWPLVHEARQAVITRVIAMPHEVGRVRTAMALSWSGSYN